MGFIKDKNIWELITFKKINIILKTIFLASAFSLTLDAQTLSYSSYTTENGLPSNVITAIYQDSRGYIWIGTNNGLSVYDGGTFTNYSTVNGLNNNWITSIVESPVEPGVLWIGTIAGGISKLENGKITSYLFGTVPDSNLVEYLAIDKKGIVWTAVFNGLWKKEKNHTSMVNNPRLSEGIIISDKNGNIWYSQKNLLYIHLLNDNKFKKLNLHISEEASIESMLCDNEGNIWVGTSNKFIMEIDSAKILRSEISKYGIPYRMIDNGQGSLIIRSHDIFFSVSKKDLSIQKFLSFPKNNEAPYDVTPPFFIDRENNIWMGTWYKGLLKVSDPFLYKAEFSGEKITTSGIDQNGHIWAAVKKGIWEIFIDNNNIWKKKLHHLPAVKENTLKYIAMVDKKNRLWLNINGKIYIYKILQNRNNFSSLAVSPLISIAKFMNGKLILEYYIDRHDRLWLCTSESGVAVVDLKTKRFLKSYTIDDGIPSKSIRAICEDKYGQIWIGGWFNGISVFCSKSDSTMPVFKRRFTVEDGLPNNMIRSIYQDSLGEMWVGTRHGGVAVFRNNKFLSASMKNGLRSNTVWAVIQGPKNEMWLSTDVGIEQIDKNTLKVIPSEKELITGQIFSLNNYNNKIWCFNSINGLFIYKYPQIKGNKVYPLTYITKILINGSSAPVVKNLKLSSAQNNVTIEFAGLSFKEEQSVKYQYRLIGADTNWTTPSSPRHVVFAFLKPGNYKFEVKAISADGIESKLPASISFIINPPFWYQWWFIALMIFFLSVSIFFAFNYRLKQLTKLERLRLRIASDLHDDVGTNLSNIIISSQIIKNKFPLGDKEIERINQLGSVASKTQNMLKDIVWLINPKNDSSEEFMMKLKSIASNLLVDIPYKINFDEKAFLLKMPIEIKRNIILIYKEILNNIVKHSHAKNVEIKFEKNKDLTVMEISDNGIGFNFSGITPGNGLSNLKSRADLIGASLKIETFKSKGIRIILTLNITQMRTGKGLRTNLF